MIGGTSNEDIFKCLVYLLSVFGLNPNIWQRAFF